jgi:8-oxo-dGTP pyrophosphatase MutT (NUDIX family)
MKKIDINVKITKPFHNLKRGKHVIVAVVTLDNKVLTGAKTNFYPPMITRLLGGGIDDNESPLCAAAREMNEEIGIKSNLNKLKQIAIFDITATDSDGNIYHNETTTFLYKIDEDSTKFGNRIDNIKPLSWDDLKKHDIDGIMALTLDELKQLGERYDALDETLWYINPDYFGSREEFSWHDYGQIYGLAHKEIAKLLKSEI